MLQKNFLQLFMALLALVSAHGQEHSFLRMLQGKPESSCHNCDCFTCKGVTPQADGSLNVDIGHCKDGSISWMCCAGVDGGSGNCNVKSGGTGAKCSGAKCETIAKGASLTINVPATAKTFSINTHDGQTAGNANMLPLCGGSGGNQGGSCAKGTVTAHCLKTLDLVKDCKYTPSTAASGSTSASGSTAGTASGSTVATTSRTVSTPVVESNTAPTDKNAATSDAGKDTATSGSGSSGPASGNKAEATCAKPIPNPFSRGDQRCCETVYGTDGQKWGSCDTSSCVENFDAKNLLCHSYGSTNFKLGSSSTTKKGGSAICPYYESDHAICDTSYYNKLNGKRCRNNGNGAEAAKNHCLGKVKCQSSGLLFPADKKLKSYGVDEESNKVDGAGGKSIDYTNAAYKCNDEAEKAGLGAGTTCFYMGTSENWKVCGGSGMSDAEETDYLDKRCLDKEGLPKPNCVPQVKEDASPVTDKSQSGGSPDSEDKSKDSGSIEDRSFLPPNKPPTKGSGSGDPHFKTWTGDKYDYHGECDLVLVNSPTFMDGLGLRVHIRTTRVKYFSYIEKVAVMIGDDVLEFDNDVENFLINGQLAEANAVHHKTMLGGFVVRRDPKALSIRLHQEGRHDHFVAKIDLHTRKNGFPAVIVDGGNTEIFKGSLGLLGDWETGRRLARDGVTELSGPDATAFALEWQVRDTEPMLFKEARFPQYPTTCTPPAEQVGFRLGASAFQKEAEEACAHWKEDMEDCIFDVIATRDVLVAEEGHIVHLS